MTDVDSASAQSKTIDSIALAKKHRISVDDARAIVSQFGTDRKAADKAARRIAA
ncbi:hypothetical protein D3C87_2005290 [compost metagenome]